MPAGDGGRSDDLAATGDGPGADGGSTPPDLGSSDLAFPPLKQVKVNSMTTANLRAVAGDSSARLVVSGDSGTLVTRTGGQWSVTIDPSQVSMRAVVPDNGSFWVGGESGRVIVSSDLMNWPAASVSPVGSIYGGALLAAGVPLFGGENAIASYDAVNDKWLTETNSVDGIVTGLWLAPDGTGYASLDSNNADSAWTRDPMMVSWSSLLANTAGNMGSVWSVGRDIYLVGDLGAIQHFTGGAWHDESVGGSDDLNCVWASGPTDIWVVGDSGTLYRSHGDGGWSIQPTNTSVALYGVWGFGPGDVYVVGANGTIIELLP